MPIFYREFQSVLYWKFIHKREHDARKVAQEIGVSTSALYKWIEGECTFPPDLIARLYSATGDLDFLNFVLADTDLMLTPRPGAKHSSRTLEGEALDVSVAVGEMHARVVEAEKDGVLSELEKRRIERGVNKAQQELEDVRAMLRKGEAA